MKNQLGLNLRGFSQLARRVNRRLGQSGITLLETMIAMVVVSVVVLPSLGFASLSMGEQVAARTLTVETTNLGSVDLALVRDVAAAKAAIPSTDTAGNQKPNNAIGDCSGGQGAGGQVVLALITPANYRVVYSLETLSNPALGKNLWRRECPNDATVAIDPPLDDPPLRSSDAPTTVGSILAQRIETATSSCPGESGGQSLSCEQVKLSMVSVDRSKMGDLRPPVVVQAVRRSNGYALPNTPPIPKFNFAPSTVLDLTKVQFDASSSRDPRGGPLTYKWDFGAPVNSSTTYDSLPKPAAVTVPERTTASVPPLSVTLTVKNLDGVERSLTKEVPLGVADPTAAIIQPTVPAVVTKGQDVTFEPELKTFSTADIASKTWDWGDGDIEEACPGAAVSAECVAPNTSTHTFQNIGTFTVKLSVVDTRGRTAEAQLSVKVEPDTVYVRAADGNDLAPNCGVFSLPCKTVDRGLSQAKTGSKPNVVVAVGSYPPFSLLDGISVEGGWNADFSVRPDRATSNVIGAGSGEAAFGIRAIGRSGAKVTGFAVATSSAAQNSGDSTQGILVESSDVTIKQVTIVGGQGKQPTGLLIKSNSDVLARQMTVTSPVPNTASSSAYAVRVLNSEFWSNSSDYIAAPGHNGADSPAAVPGTKSQAGTNSGDCVAQAGTNGGTKGQGCANDGGKGGSKGAGTSCGKGDRGMDGSGLGLGGGPGGNWFLCFGGDDGGSGKFNSTKAAGGIGGAGGSNLPKTNVTALWEGDAGHDGKDGTKGAGGAGGGGGGGGAANNGGGGGGGGAGGVGGTKATSGGSAGGGSFGIFSYKSDVTVTGGSIKVGMGGSGGRGQKAGGGQTGGIGASGGDNSGNEGRGGGGAGGSGGGGGGGAGGGAGGPSIGVFLVESTLSQPLNAPVTRPNAGGAGGAGGGSGASGGGGIGGRGWGDGYGAGGSGGWAGSQGDTGIVGLSHDVYTKPT